MAFDFPASPTTGTVSNGYVYDGVGWTGGPGVSGPVTEQFFTLDGLSTIDITVPTWAKGVQIIGNLFNSGATQINSLRISQDGATFLQGAADYTYMAAHHNSVTPFYYTNAGTTYSYMPLCNPGAPPDNTTVPSNFTLEMQLTRTHSPAQQFVSKLYEVDFSSAGSRSGQQNWAYCYCVPPVAGNAKALRVYSSAVWAASSWLKVRWIGDSAAIPQSNAIADAPNDAYQYLRGQNAWNSGGTFKADIGINRGTTSQLILNKLSGGEANVFGWSTTGPRWLVCLGNGTAESGANAGSDFAIHRYADNGAWLATGMSIRRSDGLVTIPDKFVVGHAGTTTPAGMNGVGGACITSAGITSESDTYAYVGNKIGANGWVMPVYHGQAHVGGMMVSNGTTTTFATTSDGRRKEDRKDFDAGPIIDDLIVYDFKWTNSDVRAHGVIAQDAIEVFPEAIFYDEEQDTWGTDYSKFVPLLLQEIKALRARVASLESTP